MSEIPDSSYVRRLSAEFRRRGRYWRAIGFVLCLFLCAPLAAADHFVCDCATGAAPGCVAGNDAAAGNSPATAWRSYDRAQDAWSGLAAGDSIHFCRGGVFPIAGSTQWLNTQCTAAQRCGIEAYSAAWASGGEARPRLVQSSGHGFNFANAGDAAPDGGYRVRDLELACTACTNDDWGLFFFNDVDDVRLERLRITGFGIGVHLAGSNPCGSDPGCDGHSSRIELVDSEIEGNRTQGWLGAGDDLLLAGNRFAGNGTGTVFQHNVYLSQSNGATHRIRVVRNALYRSAASASGSCQGGSFAVHGEHTDLLIEGNTIREDLGAADPACWGLGITPAYGTPEGFVRTIVRGNTFRNVGNIAIALGSCQDCVVENNVIVGEQSFGGIGIAAPAVARAADDLPLARLTVRNNSLYLTAPSSIGIRLGDEGSQHVVVSNALHSTTTSGSWSCLSLNLAFGAYAAVDNNVCGFVTGAGREWEQGSGSLAAWRAASGFDAASLAVAPGFASPAGPGFQLEAASASAAMVGAGHASASSPTEFYGASRTVPPDAGAYQYGTSDRLFRDGFGG
ncbi:MAG TPA: right-handed parallel beta-helix repeat-containing protein [Tahibacter sp.]|uniref:right-handed parallel beta-helix repeat-containing protein n=1 Tax=Tahibacter sp. TaxID=2056211 RepID=UPI002CB3A40B|nr:right-handed parallel beta-helix repeat-containing protein [Tahibacter sp.]HSX60834.1 right-handed parallel beta-helix repeat-containing protein [Tahibacter sp.]